MQLACTPVQFTLNVNSRDRKSGMPRVELQSKRRNKSISPQWIFFSWAKHTPFQSSLSCNYSPRKKGTYAPDLQRAGERRSKAGQRCRETRQTIRDVYEGVQKVKHNRWKPFFFDQSIPSSLYALSTCSLISNYILSNLKKTTVRIKIQFTNVA
jgi:hypothetical protein